MDVDWEEDTNSFSFSVSRVSILVSMDVDWEDWN